MLKKLAGNPGHRALPKSEPQPEPMLTWVEPPRHLSAIAQDEWRRLAPELIRLGLLTIADFGTLAAYCAAWADFVMAEKALQRGSAVTKGKEKQPVRSPWFIVKYKAMDALVRIGDRFGFSPSARVSLAGSSGEPPAPPAPTGIPDGGRPQSLETYIASNPDARH
ncbi:phage terminase small subunit P27 family [Reyranella sp.]|uniref:phage terminase small subunit P27 family n=1 Tax=Reyranella sp. TaxID=1929291 RepID=UPI00272F15FF|nr:phage terminase small subunit P27 family [Reyranella sp.]MDP2377773.1 phage terminase small subunit P27 family [Reyranella sp.]